MPTKDQVRQAIEDLEAAGAHISPTTIRQQLGDHGSFRDIVQHYKQIVSEGPRRRATNGTHAISATLSPPPAPATAPAPAPVGDRARLEHYLDLARQKKTTLEAEMEELRVRAGQAMRMDDVREFNRKIVGAERALEAVGRDIAQYLSEISRLR